MGSFGVKPWAFIDKSINGGKIRDGQYKLEGKLKRRCVLRGKKIIGVDSVFGPIFCSMRVIYTIMNESIRFDIKNLKILSNYEVPIIPFII